MHNHLKQGKVSSGKRVVETKATKRDMRIMKSLSIQMVCEICPICHQVVYMALSQKNQPPWVLPTAQMGSGPWNDHLGFIGYLKLHLIFPELRFMLGVVVARIPSIEAMKTKSIKVHYTHGLQNLKSVLQIPASKIYVQPQSPFHNEEIWPNTTVS